MKKFYKILTKILIAFLIIVFFITEFFVLIRYDLFKLKPDPTIYKVYEKMNSLDSVKINRVLKADMPEENRKLYANQYAWYENTFVYDYNYDVSKKWGNGKSSTINVSGEKKEETEEDFSFVKDNGVYHYCFENGCSKISRKQIYLDDYQYILLLLKNSYDAIKKDKNTYELKISNDGLQPYFSYFNSLHGMNNYDEFFPKLSIYYALPSINNTTVTIKITDDYYLSEIKIDMPAMYDTDYSITYSDYNNANVEIPISVLATLSGDN